MSKERVEKSIAWFEAHRSQVAALLPARAGAVTYLPVVLEICDRWIGYWRAGDLPMNLATAYILRPIRKLYLIHRSHGQK